MLVDERTIGSGEEAGLFLEAANKTDFVGSPTAGAHSVFTQFTVPGGVTVTFSGQDVRHANGGKLQRLGLQPNVTVAPTLTGIRTGKDEVLEKALESLLPKVPVSKTLPTRASARE
jgi:C-terminal processing protease CtpA/Prc